MKITILIDFHLDQTNKNHRVVRKAIATSVNSLKLLETLNPLDSVDDFATVIVIVQTAVFPFLVVGNDLLEHELKISTSCLQFREEVFKVEFDLFKEKN